MEIVKKTLKDVPAGTKSAYTKAMQVMNQKFGLITHMQEEVNIMCNLSEAIEEQAIERTTEQFKIAMNLYRSGERDKDVYRSEGISEDVIAVVFGE